MDNIKYTKNLIKRIEDGVKKMDAAASSEEISEQERLIHPVLKELQMVAPRVWDDFIKSSRDNRKRLTDGR